MQHITEIIQDRVATIRRAILALPHGGQAALSRKSGISPQHLSDFAHGRRPMTPRIADKLSDALGL